MQQKCRIFQYATALRDDHKCTYAVAHSKLYSSIWQGVIHFYSIGMQLQVNNELAQIPQWVKPSTFSVFMRHTTKSTKIYAPQKFLCVQYYTTADS